MSSPLPLTDSGSGSVHARFVDFHFRASDLVRLDKRSKSDPFVVVSQRLEHGAWHEVARTCTMWDSHLCTFGTAVSLHFLERRLTVLKFEVWDRDADREKLSAHDLVGFCQTDSAVMTARAKTGDTIEFQLVHPKRPLNADGKSPSGVLHVTLERRMWATRSGIATLKIGAEVAGRVSATPALQLEVQRERAKKPGEFVGVFRSDVLSEVSGAGREPKEDYRVMYMPVSLNYDLLRNADELGCAVDTTPLRIMIFVVESMRTHHIVSRPVGWLDTSFESLRLGVLSVPQALQVGEEGLQCGALDIKKDTKSSVAKAEDFKFYVVDFAVGV